VSSPAEYAKRLADDTERRIGVLPMTLRLPASKLMPRKLVINWGPKDVLVMMFGAAGAPTLASAAALVADVSLRKLHGGAAELLLGGASFELPPPEAELVLGMFAPRGLRITDMS
jgi:hypothetical protein